MHIMIKILKAYMQLYLYVPGHKYEDIYNIVFYL